MAFSYFNAYYTNMNTHDINILHEWLGDKGIITNEKECAPYTQGWRGNIGKCAAVLRPTSTKDVSRIISYCARRKIHLIPQSGNTGLVGGSIPDDSGTQVILSFDRMNEIKDIDPANKSISVQAGVRMSALNNFLEEHGLFFPIDISADPCIGGMIATNTGGARYMKYRGVREHLLGIKAVLADKHGTIIDTMIPLHKNNTGLDIKQLFVGTGGICGVITEASLLLSQLPKQSATALLIPRDKNDINELLISLEQKCGQSLSAFEGMSGNAIKAALKHSPSLTNPFGNDEIPDYAILMEITRDWEEREGEQSLDDVLELILEEVWKDSRTPLDNALIGAPEKLWALRHALSEGVQKSGKQLFAFDISFKRSDVMRFISFMEGMLTNEYPELTICDFGHIGDGAVHFNLVLKKNSRKTKKDEYESELRSLVTDIVVNNYGGSFSAEHGIGRKNQKFYDLYTPEEIKAVTRAIKGAVAPVDIGAIKV